MYHMYLGTPYIHPIVTALAVLILVGEIWSRTCAWKEEVLSLQLLLVANTVQMINQHNDKCTLKDLKLALANVGMSEDRLTRALAILVKDGQLKNTSSGGYLVTQEGRRYLDRQFGA